MSLRWKIHPLKPNSLNERHTHTWPSGFGLKAIKRIEERVEVFFILNT